MVRGACKKESLLGWGWLFHKTKFMYDMVVSKNCANSALPTMGLRALAMVQGQQTVVSHPQKPRQNQKWNDGGMLESLTIIDIFGQPSTFENHWNDAGMAGRSGRKPLVETVLGGLQFWRNTV